MTIKKTVALVVSALLCISILSGYAEKQENASIAQKTAPVEAESATKVVVDDLGREVTIPVKPERILALNSARIEELFSLGVTPVGKVDEYKIRQEGIDLPSVGQSKNINIEAIYYVKPDLIIAHTRNHGNIVKALEETGFPVYYFDPSLNQKLSDNDVLMFLAELIGKEDEAQKYIEELKAFSEGYKKRISEETDIKTGVIIKDGDTIQAAQTASGFGAVLTALGIENIVPDDLPGAASSSFVNFDIETILEKNPDIVLIMASSNDKAQNKELLQKYINDPKWTSLDAVKNKRVMILPFKVNPNRSSRQDMIRITAEKILSTLKK
jgi:iron complex transport system substrate-binding protein